MVELPVIYESDSKRQPRKQKLFKPGNLSQKIIILLMEQTEKPTWEQGDKSATRNSTKLLPPLGWRRRGRAGLIGPMGQSHRTDTGTPWTCPGVAGAREEMWLLLERHSIEHGGEIP